MQRGQAHALAVADLVTALARWAVLLVRRCRRTRSTAVIGRTVQPLVPPIAIRIDIAPGLDRTSVGLVLAVMVAGQNRDGTAEEAERGGRRQNGFRLGEHGCVSSLRAILFARSGSLAA